MRKFLKAAVIALSAMAGIGNVSANAETNTVYVLQSWGGAPAMALQFDDLSHCNRAMAGFNNAFIESERGSKKKYTCIKLLGVIYHPGSGS